MLMAMRRASSAVSTFAWRASALLASCRNGECQPMLIVELFNLFEHQRAILELNPGRGAMGLGETIQYEAHRIRNGTERSAMGVSRDPKRLCGLIKF
jgi:hypothetical protein